MPCPVYVLQDSAALSPAPSTTTSCIWSPRPQSAMSNCTSIWKKFWVNGCRLRRQESKELLDDVHDGLRQVVRCCRGLIALMHPQFGIYGSTQQDVEAISKPKKARTCKSGVSGAPTQSSAETDMMQLVSE